MTYFLDSMARETGYEEEMASDNNSIPYQGRQTWTTATKHI